MTKDRLTCFRTQQFARPYFRDWSNLDLHKGKSFLSPPRLFRGDVSLYFPNLIGKTLLKSRKEHLDTTLAIAGKVSVVAIFNSVWGDAQAQTFISKRLNPELHAVLEKNPGKAQLVQINIEENWLKRWLIYLFKWRLRKQVGKESWGRYFIVSKGASTDIRESIGLLNSKVGYVYLVDPECKIRWAGSGESLPEEREGLAKGVQRLLDDVSREPSARGAPPRTVPSTQKQSA
jgi:mitochondrial ATPase complex subunit ATP10